MEVKVEQKITIKIGETTIHLESAEARSLLAQLKTELGENSGWYPYPYPYPYTYPQNPLITWTTTNTNTNTNTDGETIYGNSAVLNENIES
ncbi:MAG: hypothetical protein DRJ01_00980 [Bacteroidetes bacterium]|nr:MAG: hypothetical protein DRJ01_00980 [Bacteroidota bacterium]